ncbi:S-layer homology domain-containing protein [Clostridium aminobutyricum]|uniref:S-layer homology domain-containing protein n=1 Tax=Clostridium aminobutyricum TaxID=33953 RepID=A0A939DAN7_CLOAM|nr:S-layer homology domain-containing protein [Clostridium aminobutyricum]MBN7773828.1 S-layer homology domain-containing protein [Clostridium aminobutyricum]
MKLRISVILMTVVLLILGSFSFAQAAVQGSEASAANFSDISKHWSKDAVQNLMMKKAIPFNGDQFFPNKAVERSEFAIMLHNALDIQIEYLMAPKITDYFDDVEQDAAYTSAVIDLVTANILEGKGSFKPDGTLTREEMIHFIMQAYKYKMGDDYALIKIAPATFADTDKISPEYSGEVARAQHYNLIAGDGSNLFNPQGTATRAETAVVINRLIELLDGQQSQKVTVTPEATVKDDSIVMKITLKNNSGKDVYIENTSGQKLDFELLDGDKNPLYRWSADKAFTLALMTTKVEAGETLEFSDTLSGEQYKAIKDKIVYMKGYIIGTADFINAEGYEIKIK